MTEKPMNETTMLVSLGISFVVCIGSAMEKAWGWFNLSLIILFCSAFGLVMRIIS